MFMFYGSDSLRAVVHDKGCAGTNPIGSTECDSFPNHQILLLFFYDQLGTTCSAGLDFVLLYSGCYSAQCDSKATVGLISFIAFLLLTK